MFSMFRQILSINLSYRCYITFKFRFVKIKSPTPLLLWVLFPILVPDMKDKYANHLLTDWAGLNLPTGLSPVKGPSG